MRILCLLFSAFLSSISSAVEPAATEWGTITDVVHLTRALSVCEFPIRQADLKKTLGLKKGRILNAVSTSRRPGVTAVNYGITDPSAITGYYVARAVFQDSAEGVKPDDFEIVSMEVLFFPGGRTYLEFSLKRGEIEAELIPELKAKVKSRGITPAQYADELQSTDDALGSLPNKSLQPTATAVTPPAAQEIAPAVAVAEH